MTKLATVFVVAIALAIALSGNQNVFVLVLIAWAALASAFAPLMVVYALGGKPSESVAVMMMLTGFGVMLLWRGLGGGSIVYEIAPGVLAGFVPYLVARFMGRGIRSSLAR